MEKLSNLLNEYGKYLFACSLALKPSSKGEIELMLEMLKNDTNR